MAWKFNPPPEWPPPPDGWVPPPGWTPPRSWPEPPFGWQLWIQQSDRDQDPASPGEVRPLHVSVTGRESLSDSPSGPPAPASEPQKVVRMPTLRIALGSLLCLWAVFVWWVNTDFWDGFVFPWLASTAGVYQILLGRTALKSSAHAVPPRTPSATAEAVRTGTVPTGVGPWAGRFATSVGVSVVSAILIKLLGV
jgi:hypothetical protein